MLDRTPESSRTSGDLGRDESGTIPFVPHGERAGTVSFSGPAALSTPHDQHLDTAALFPTVPGYRIVGVLGNGGMGNVYQAFEPGFNRLVALKLLREYCRRGDTVAKRFAAEAHLLAQLDHRNVVRVYAVGEAGGRPFFAMKYVSGGSLDGHLAEYRVSAGHAVRLLVKLARAVQYLHDRGVWHRDLKPLNILLDEEGEPLVADFGVAKWLEGESHTVGFGINRVGTYAYMAPEMIRHGSASAGARADVWSLGVILFELLTGVRPFPGHGDDPQLIRRIESEPPLPLAQPAAAPGIDEGLERIVLKALAKDPCRRYQTAAALAADLDAWLGDGTAADAPTLADARRHAAHADATTASFARPQRRPAVLGGFLAAVGGLFALAWPVDPAPPKAVLPAAARPAEPLLAAYATRGKVIVVDDAGKRRYPLTPVPASLGILQEDGKRGELTASGSPLALFEISATEPPPPYRLRAKVYHSWGDFDAYAGLYVRRAAAKGGSGNEHHFYAVVVDSRNDRTKLPGTLSHGPFWLDLNQQTESGCFFLRMFDRNIPRQLVHPADYRELVIDVYADRVEVASDGQPCEPVSWPLARTVLGARTARRQPPPPPPSFGGGFGLVLLRGTAAFRDVTVSRIPSP